jgi:enoyl-CoA hydratase
MNSEQLSIKEDNFVVTLMINRPEKRNMLTPGLFRQMIEAIERLAAANQARVLVLTGAGDQAFSAGFDITEIPGGEGGEATAEGVAIIEEALAAVRECAIPTIAMINGYAVGAGLDLAVNCDFRICRAGARLGITPAKLGLVYFHSGIRRFLNLVGLSATRYLFLTGRLVDSETALRLGLVDRVAAAGELERVTYDLAREIALDSAPLSVRGMKYMINMLSSGAAVTGEQEREFARIMLEAINSEDTIEGRLAFREKRKPVFKGK